MARQMRRPLGMELVTLARQQQARRMATNSSSVAAALSAKAEVSAAKQPSGSSIKGTLGKRFYKNAHVKPVASVDHDQQQQKQQQQREEEGAFEISLDRRLLRSPAKKPLQFSNPALAHAIAAEWEWQVTQNQMIVLGF